MGDDEGSSVDELPSDGLTDGLSDGLSDGLADGLSDGVSEGLSDGVSDGISEGLSDGVAELPDEVSLVLLSDELGNGSEFVEVGNGGETTIVLEMMTVVTLESLGEFDSELDCLLVVSKDELGGRVSDEVIVALVNWRLTCWGK